MENEQLKITTSTVIRERVSGYLNFDIDRLFKNRHTLAIFGGATRDSVANKEIHDVDILCLPKATMWLIDFFEREGFKKSRANYDIEHMYKEVRVISEPITYEKFNTKVQLIRPNPKYYTEISPDNMTDAHYEEVFYKVLTNVDLSCCGIYYINGYAYESCKGAIEDSLNNEFKILEDNIMHNPSRINDRVMKLVERGWKRKK
jgi:hypothetical protein